jgi:hypothetical protein
MSQLFWNETHTVNSTLCPVLESEKTIVFPLPDFCVSMRPICMMFSLMLEPSEPFFACLSMNLVVPHPSLSCVEEDRIAQIIEEEPSPSFARADCCRHREFVVATLIS